MSAAAALPQVGADVVLDNSDAEHLDAIRSGLEQTVLTLAAIFDVPGAPSKGELTEEEHAQVVSAVFTVGHAARWIRETLDGYVEQFR